MIEAEILKRLSDRNQTTMNNIVREYFQHLFLSVLLPPYTLLHLDERKLVSEKVQACLTRGKARDFYDLYFILRNRMAFKETFSKDKTIKTQLVKVIAQTKLDIKNELRRFLPASQHMLLKDFKSILLAEVERNLP